MSLIAVGLIAAAAAGVSGLLAARAIARRRRKAEAAPESSADDQPVDEPKEPDPLQDWPARVGDVIEVGEATRWPRSATLVISDGVLECALLLSSEAGQQQATAMMAPPDRHLYWLEARQVEMPPSPPGRIEVDDMLLDRKVSFPAELRTIGEEPPELGDSARFAFYQSSSGDAAIVLQGSATFVWYGRRIPAGEYDLLGQGELEEEAEATS